ncbi:MAG: alkaline phosphatase [Gammaproteobacteria bacterium]|nr:MAG: alkaline phosphatase [Gammaproteobacteria bacterium]
MRRIISVCAITAAALVSSPVTFADDDAEYSRRRAIKNVIFMVPDGCDASVQTLARWMKGETLQLDSMNNGMVRTEMANSVITGSAAASTAFATGEKTTARFLGIAPRTEDMLSTYIPPVDKEPYEPMASVLEGAKQKGKATGLISTSRVTHATPAGFAAHIHDRGMDNEIMEHMVYQDIDVVFGGGKRHLLPKSEGGKRTDGENLVNVLVDRGYQFVETKDQLEDLEEGKAWGMFASSHMKPDIDRAEFAPEEPSIAEMTAKAIELLSQDRDGFFLMVEGSQVDWAGHANDPKYMFTDFIAFDDAVKVAVDFAKMDGQTVVIAFPDHNTGALSIGNTATDKTYTSLTVEDMMAPLMGMRVTGSGLATKIGDDWSPENIVANIQEWWGISATMDDANEILAHMEKGYYPSYAIGYVISKNHTVFGWTTHGHNAEDVQVWTYGINYPLGTIDNTDLAKMAAMMMRFDLKDVDADLFIEVSEAFSADEWELDTVTDPENPVLHIKDAVLPVSKDLVIQGDKTTEMEGIVVYAPMSEKVYIPKEAVRIINGDDDVEDCPWPWPWLCEYYARNK